MGRVIEEEKVRRRYEALTLRLIGLERTITTMESCTAGQIASLLTDTSGSSAILKGAFVTYSNEAKIRQGVPEQVIAEYGVYSAQTAQSMAQVCREAFGADYGIGITGSFGDVDPNNADSVPGEVYFAIASGNGVNSYHCSVPVQPSRLLYKLYMADMVAEELEKQL